ncbi:protein serine/threonine phosphatase [Thiothrix nivea DSM 5205]|uniref:Protein serine/threonine phosphatase n=2 Tax=Thiothrix nivea TaxID=1031 RepID=A0A656HGA7_THINJ|nr:protein serine/threonine phosphatase [Thiothrix nivea DSM 5205]
MCHPGKAGSNSVGLLMPERKLLHILRGYCCPVCAPNQYRGMAVSMRGPRAENQDNYLLVQPGGQAEWLVNEQLESRRITGWGNQWWRLLVADGMGGHRNGREVSEALVQLALEIRPVWEVSVLRQTLNHLHQQLLARFGQQHDQHSPGATLVWVDVHVSGLVMLAHVGDSRLYQWREGRQAWRQVTHDHTWQEFAWRVDAEAGSPLPQEKGLAQAMGYGSYGVLANTDGARFPAFSPQLHLELAEEMLPHARAHADVTRLSLPPGDALLLSTDGLWATPGRDVPSLPSLNELDSSASLDTLAEDALAAGGRDNTTVVLLRPYAS